MAHLILLARALAILNQSRIDERAGLMKEDRFQEHSKTIEQLWRQENCLRRQKETLKKERCNNCIVRLLRLDLKINWLLGCPINCDTFKDEFVLDPDPITKTLLQTPLSGQGRKRGTRTEGNFELPKFLPSLEGCNTASTSRLRSPGRWGSSRWGCSW